MPQTKDLLRLRPHLEIMMQSKVQISCALRRMLCCQYSQRSPGYESKSGYVLAGPGVQIVERGRKIPEEKKRPPPPLVFPVYNLLAPHLPPHSTIWTPGIG